MSKPLVWRDRQGYINVQHPDIKSYVYDFKVNESTPLRVWLRQLHSKTWFSQEHERQLLSVVGEAA